MIYAGCINMKKGKAVPQHTYGGAGGREGRPIGRTHS
jgi:hypothetical protein